MKKSVSALLLVMGLVMSAPAFADDAVAAKKDDAKEMKQDVKKDSAVKVDKMDAKKDKKDAASK